jgi:glc operon protein GlcG
MFTRIGGAILVAACLVPLAVRAQMPNAYGAAISSEAARRVAAAALAEGRKNGWTIAVAIVDPGGVLVHFERHDATQNAASEVAPAKARSAAAFKRPTKVFEDALAGPAGPSPAVGRLAILGLPGAVPLEGGLPLVIDGKIVGAVGVSGAASPQDGICARAGADALAKSP